MALAQSVVECPAAGDCLDRDQACAAQPAPLAAPRRPGILLHYIVQERNAQRRSPGDRVPSQGASWQGSEEVLT